MHKSEQLTRTFKVLVFYEIAGLYVHVNRNITLLPILNRIQGL